MNPSTRSKPQDSPSLSVEEVLNEMQQYASESTKRTFMRHGAQEPCFGVKIGDLKKLQKKIKRNQALAMELFDSGSGEAMYLAGLVCDPSAMTKADLQRWVKAARWPMVSEYTVAWAASESRFGWELAQKWIQSPKELIAVSGWSTLSSLVSIRADDDLDLPAIKALLVSIPNQIDNAPNRVRYVMNGFVIAVGCYVRSLTDAARKVARKLGKVEVDVGETDCKVPDAEKYIAYVESLGRVGKKRKSAFC